jgi:RHS repeat-associated protein
LKVIAEGTGTNDKVFYTNAPGAVGGIICRDENGTKYWFHFDRLGNAVGVTDSNGAVARVYHNRSAFGMYWPQYVFAASGYDQYATDVQPYHLTTKEWDADAGLYYFAARWYAPWEGRFLSRAPVPVEEEHPYTLAAGNPLVRVDPSGTSPENANCWIAGAVTYVVCTVVCGWRKTVGKWDCAYMCFVLGIFTVVFCTEVSRAMQPRRPQRYKCTENIGDPREDPCGCAEHNRFGTPLYWRCVQYCTLGHL